MIPPLWNNEIFTSVSLAYHFQLDQLADFLNAQQIDHVDSCCFSRQTAFTILFYVILYNEILLARYIGLVVKFVRSSRSMPGYR